MFIYLEDNQQSMEKRYIGYILMTIVALIWGIGYTATKICLQIMDPLTLALTRFLFSAIFFVPLMIKLWKKPKLKDLLLIAVMGLTGVMLYQSLYNSGANGVSAGVGSIVISTEPIFIFLLSVIFIGERFSILKMAGIIISFIGIIFISINSITNILSIVSIILILLASIAWCVYTIISKDVLERYDAMFVTSLSMVFGTVFLLPFVSKMPADLVRLNTIEIFSLAFLVVFATFIAFYLNFKGLQMLTASRASVFYYLSPLFTIISAYFIIHEAITATIIIGGIMVIGGVALVNR
jgi:drug/metabolite transporter (DMT)-like permease